MRLSEKTIELNFCAQLTAAMPSPVLWFGLTQRQEAAAGFDAATRLHKRLLLFQFKASDYILRSGYRRFYLSHHQLSALQTRAKRLIRSVFYTFPFLGTTLELSKNPRLLAQTGLLDVATLPTMSPPTTSSGSLRRNELHYADIRPWTATIHSEPVDVRLEPATELAAGRFQGADGLGLSFESFDDFWEFRAAAGGTMAAAILL